MGSSTQPLTGKSRSCDRLFLLFDLTNDGTACLWSHTVLYCSPDGPCKQNIVYEMLLFPLVRTVIEVSQSRNGISPSWYGGQLTSQFGMLQRALSPQHFHLGRTNPRIAMSSVLSPAQSSHGHIQKRFMVVGEGFANILTVLLFGIAPLSIRKYLALTLTRSLIRFKIDHAENNRTVVRMEWWTRTCPSRTSRPGNAIPLIKSPPNTPWQCGIVASVA